MTYEPATADVAEELLHNLRGRLGTDSVDYAEPPESIHGGFDNFIYAFRLSGAPPRFSGRLILRLYRPDTDPRQACFESAIQNVLAFAGYPSPPVLLIGRSGDGVIPPILKRTAFGDERTVRGVVQRFHAITGKTLQIPDAGR
jgi:hypothetical protein